MLKWSKSANSVKGFVRVGGITRILVKHGLGEVATRLFKRQTGSKDRAKTKSPGIMPDLFTPNRFRLVLEELGPSFIKLGQLLSTRADILPAEFVEELARLQDRVPPVPFEDIRKVIETALNQPLTEIFADIEAKSIAAASVAQVHRARLQDGTEVAVKVVRPGIAKKIQEDIRLMFYLARKLEKMFELGQVIGAENLVSEFERTIFKELDMLIEAGNIEKFARNFQDSNEIYIPKVYWDCCAKGVLVMEFIEGIKVDQVAVISANGIDPKEIAMIGLRSFSRQLMEFGYFHGDPHPGNTIVMYDSRVSLVDFGIIGYLDEEMMRQIAHLFLGFAEHDYDLVIEALWEAGLVDDHTMDLKSFRTDLKDMCEPFYGRALKTISVKDVYDQIMRLVYKYHIRLPRNLLLLLKTLIQTEALGKILGSDANILEVTRPYARKLLQKGYDARKIFKSVGHEARNLGGYMKMMPRFVHEILKQTAGGKQRIELWHEGFDQKDRKLEKGVNRLTLGMVISASTIAASLVLNSDQEVIRLSFNFFGMQTMSITSLLGITGYVIATILGIWLIISIFRSGRM